MIRWLPMLLLLGCNKDDAETADTGPEPDAYRWVRSMLLCPNTRCSG
jgi:hypothetical protein